MGAYYCGTCCNSGVDIKLDVLTGDWRCSECNSVIFDNVERGYRIIEGMRDLFNSARYSERIFNPDEYVWRIGDDIFEIIHSYADRTSNVYPSNDDIRIFGIRVELDHTFKRRLQLFKEIRLY